METSPHHLTSSTSTPASARLPLLVGAAAALLASGCCLGPLVLVLLGFSGAWIGNLTLLEPYRMHFLLAAFIALLLAYRQIWRPASACVPGQVCARPAVRRSYRLLFWLVAALVVVAVVYPALAPLFY